jgi:ankyrin repeat protein
MKAVGAPLDPANNRRNSPLLLAVFAGHVAVVEALQRAGADPLFTNAEVCGTASPRPHALTPRRRARSATRRCTWRAGTATLR